MMTAEPQTPQQELQNRIEGLRDDFIRDCERKLSSLKSVTVDHEIIEEIGSISREIEETIYKIERQMEIRDGVSEYSHMIGSQLSYAVKCGDSDRIRKLIAQPAAIGNWAWAEIVAEVDRTGDRSGLELLSPNARSIANNILVALGHCPQ